MPKTDDYLNARSIARETLLTKNPGEVSRNAGGTWNSSEGEKNIVITFLNREIVIAWPEGTVHYHNNPEGPSLQEQVSILHYLANATEAPLSGRVITFREIPAGDFYYEPFRKRAQIPMVTAFGAAPERLLIAGEKLGGVKTDLGDVAMTFPFFPKVPVTLLFWKGDAEFPPEGNILYDASISSFFNAEEIAFLTGTLIYKLMYLSKA